MKLNKLFNRIIFNCSKVFTEKKKTIFEFNGTILFQTNDAQLKTNMLAAKEIKEKCKENGFKVDRIVFLSYYDINENQGTGFSSKSTSRIQIEETEKEKIAFVIINTEWKFKENTSK